jgi:plasmid stabilization system protein ParE
MAIKMLDAGERRSFDDFLKKVSWVSSKHKAYLSPIAEYKLLKVLEYIENEFGSKSKTKFLKILSDSIRNIELNPLSCPETELKGIFKNAVTKQTSFYYRILKQEIEIITITDNRQNPEMILQELEVYFSWIRSRSKLVWSNYTNLIYANAILLKCLTLCIHKK